MTQAVQLNGSQMAIMLSPLQRSLDTWVRHGATFYARGQSCLSQPATLTERTCMEYAYLLE